jgi:hypothetical protein
VPYVIIKAAKGAKVCATFERLNSAETWRLHGLSHLSGNCVPKHPMASSADNLTWWKVLASRTVMIHFVRWGFEVATTEETTDCRVLLQWGESNIVHSL